MRAYALRNELAKVEKQAAEIVARYKRPTFEELLKRAEKLGISVTREMLSPMVMQ